MRLPRCVRLEPLWAVVALLPIATGAQTLPTASQVASRIGVGWNLGNTMEVPKSQGGPTGWGNPFPNQQLIDGVKAAGFNAVRIPCAWDGYADGAHKIDAAWLAQVKSVVDLCIKAGLYVVLNIHWDGGWLENHPLAADQAAVTEKQKAYWTQIATHFKDYDEHLIFAGMNEVNVNWQAPTAENITAQQAYIQAFVDAVRSTGGNNASRTLAIQSYSTNIGYGLDRLTLPKDSAASRLMVEVHFYDPYQYTGETTCAYWGSPYPAQSACSWAQESYVDERFAKAKARWADQGVPVIVGEWGAPRRSGQSADQLASRLYYLKYVSTAAARNGLKTFYWDTGVTSGNEVSSLFDRNTGAVFQKDAIDTIVQAAGVTTSALTVTKAGTGSGTVTSSPSGISCGATCTASFPGGTSVTLTATPATGSSFAGWSGACTGTGTCTVPMSKAQGVTATFDASTGATATLTVTGVGAGSGAITFSTVSTRCAAGVTATACKVDFPAGSSVTLTATPDAGSTFAGWGGACNGTGTCTVAMTSAQSVTARFDASSGATYTLMVGSLGDGSGDVTISPGQHSCRVGLGASACKLDFPAGTTVTVTAVGVDGSSFQGWSGDCSGTGSCTVTMTQARSVKAGLQAPPRAAYTLMVFGRGDGRGDVTVSPGPQVCRVGPGETACRLDFPTGTTVTLTAEGVGGSSFLDWSGDCSGTGPCTLAMTEARSVQARLGSGSSSGGGSGSSGGSVRTSVGCTTGGAGAAGVSLLAPGLVALLLRRRRGPTAVNAPPSA